MQQPIKIKSDYNFTYEIFQDCIILKDPQGKILVTFTDDCEYLEQALFIFRKLKQGVSDE